METKVGNTKLVKIEKIISNNNVYAKLENSNPTGSIKDRAVFQMLLDFQKEGKLNENTTIVEATSGNTGIALAYFQKVFNYKAVIVMPKSMSKERREMISKFGAELKLIDGGMLECEEVALKMSKELPNHILLNQFSNPSNYMAHYLNTAPEIDQQLKNIDYIIASFGSGGTISGIAKYFKEHYPSVKIIAVEPEESPLLTKGYAGSHLIQGIGANFIPENYKKEFIDEVIVVKGEESIKFAYELRDIEKFDVGISSGANILGVINYINKEKLTGKNIVTIFPDKGDRYSW